MTKPTDVPSSTSSAATPTPSVLPIRATATTTAGTAVNASNSRTTGPRPQPGTQSSGGSGPRPLPPTPQSGTQGSNNTGSRTQPVLSTQPHAAADNGNLRVFRDPKVLTIFDPFPLVKEFQQLSPSDPLFLAVSHCIDTALRVLEHPRGRHGLIEGGKRLVKLMRLQGSEISYKGNPDNDKEMGEWVDCFLRCVREDFPNVFVTATLIQNAVLVRLDRPAKVEKRFKPKLAGIMCLDKWVSIIFIDSQGFLHSREILTDDLEIFDNMLHQAKVIVTTSDPTMTEAAERNFRYSLFYMTVIILHEVMHLFVWYTSGDTRPATPPEMALYPSNKRRQGESGEWLECQLFGGYLKFREDPKDALKTKQTGIPFSITGQGQDVRLVDLGFITSILDPSKFCPRCTVHVQICARSREVFKGIV